MPDYTADLDSLAQLVTDDADLSEVLEQALASLRDVVPYDLAAIYRLVDGELHVIAAGGPLDGANIRVHRLRLQDYPTIRRALSQRHPIPMEAHHHDGDEGDPYDGVLNLPSGHSCMVVPLYVMDKSLGLITLDRKHCEVYNPTAVRVAGLVGQLVSMAIRFADQSALLDRYRHQLLSENRRLRSQTTDGPNAVRMIESSQAPNMKQLFRLSSQVAGSELPVLILGETGTGKEVLAKAIHELSPRAENPLVILNCAALPENLVESELFGHVKGAFTGATSNRPGAFRTANGGTLFLDEVGELPAAAQAKLLRVLQDGSFQPVGSDRTDRVDVRIIAATHVDLMEAVSNGTFREDLYYRLAVFPVEVPALRERTTDIVPIAEMLLATWAQNRRKGPWTLSPSAKSALENAPWPGNVRQLRNALERATIIQATGDLKPIHLGLAPQAAKAPTVFVKTSVGSFDDAVTTYLTQLMDQTDGKLYGDDGAAAIAGMAPSTLRSKLVKHTLR